MDGLDSRLNERLDRMEKKLESWESQKEEIISRQDQLETRIEALERQSKRNCMVITGMEVNQGKSVLETVNTFFRDRLYQDIEAVEAFAVKQRTGGQKIVARVANSEHKSRIMKSKGNLKGNDKVYINDDLIKKDQYVQYKARQLRKELKAQGKEARIGHNKIYCDGQELRWNNLEERFVKIGEDLEEKASRNNKPSTQTFR